MGLGLLVIAAWVLPHATAQVITTIAGSDFVFRGDGGLAISAPLGYVEAVTVDSSGNVFAADFYNNLVVKISPTGVLTVVAGNQFFGSSGDGGPATAASLANVSGVAVDTAGNVYLADSWNCLVRRVGTDGIIRTVVGSGQCVFSGDGGPAGAASLDGVQSIAVDPAGLLYIGTGNRIRKVDSSGNILTIAGVSCSTNQGGTCYSGDGGPAVLAKLSNPSSMVIDGTGTVYFVDRGNLRVRRIGPDGIITTIGGNGHLGFSGDGGPATQAALIPVGLAMDSTGNIYVAAAGNNRIRKIDSGGLISTVAGDGYIDAYGSGRFTGDGGLALEASLNYPQAVAVDPANNLYIADSANYRVRIVTSSGTMTTLAGNGGYQFSGDGGAAVSASLDEPTTLAVDQAGNLFVDDGFNHRVRRIGADGIITTVAGNGSLPQSGEDGDGGPAVNAPMSGVVFGGLAADAAGDLYIADNFYGTIRKVDANGILSTVVGTGVPGDSGDGGPATGAQLADPTGVTVDPAGNMFIADPGGPANRVREVTADGQIRAFAGSGGYGFSGDHGPATRATFFEPYYLAMDPTGNLFISDAYNYRVRKVDLSGIITTIAGNGGQDSSGDGGLATAASLNLPYGVAADAFGNVFVAEYSGNRIRKIAADGTISTLAGGGDRVADGVLATDSNIFAPFGIAVDGAGNVYIADQANNRIRKVLASPPALSIAPASLSFSAAVATPAVAPQFIAITGSVTQLAWTASSSAPWLTISPASGTMPGLLSASVNVAGLAAGIYQATITVQAPLTAPSAQTIPVQLTVLPGSSPAAVADQSSLAFEALSAGANPPPQTLTIGSSTGDPVNWNIQIQVLNGGNWLTVSPASGTVTANASMVVQVSANVAGLSAGAYSALLSLQSPGSQNPVMIAVALLLSQPSRKMYLTQSAIQFTAAQGSGPSPAQLLGIANLGDGVMNWTVQVQTVDGSNWLAVTANSGQSGAGAAQMAKLGLRVNAAGLTGTSYDALVRIDAPGVPNSPGLVTVHLKLAPAGALSEVQLYPPQLIFVAQAGSSSPGSQTVQLTASGTGKVQASGTIFAPGGNWLNALPVSLDVSSGDPRTITIQPEVGNLAPGQYHGALTFQFGDGSPPQAVDVFFLVGGTPASSTSAELRPQYDRSCTARTPRRLILPTNQASPAAFDPRLISKCK